MKSGSWGLLQASYYSKHQNHLCCVLDKCNRHFGVMYQSTFPIQNVELRVKRKAVLSNKVFWLYITCTGNAGKHLDFRVPFSTV